jgi:hypothetical protein
MPIRRRAANFIAARRVMAFPFPMDLWRVREFQCLEPLGLRGADLPLRSGPHESACGNPSELVKFDPWYLDLRVAVGLWQHRTAGPCHEQPVYRLYRFLRRDCRREFRENESRHDVHDVASPPTTWQCHHGIGPRSPAFVYKSPVRRIQSGRMSSRLLPAMLFALLAAQTQDGPREFLVAGTVVWASPGSSSLAIRGRSLIGRLHLQVKSYRVKQPGALAGLHPGDRITAEFSERDGMLHRLRRVLRGVPSETVK